jgi:hypothetical protein
MEADDIISLLSKHRSQGAIIDTNLVLLLVIGTYDIRRISTFKRTLKYTPEDFDLLSNLLNRLAHRITTPNIITETDNLSRQLPENEHEAVSQTLLELCTNFLEIYVPTDRAVADPLYSRLGITDCITLSLARQRRLVITDDFELANRISSLNGDVININHIRQFA